MFEKFRQGKLNRGSGYLASRPSERHTLRHAKGTQKERKSKPALYEHEFSKVADQICSSLNLSRDK
jgi:hypothetical protein